MVEERLAEEIQHRLDEDGRLSCAAAFRVAEELDIEPIEVGWAADGLGIRLSRCQLGLFGYGPKETGEHRIVRPAQEAQPEMARMIQERLVDGELPCKVAWEIAAALSVPKMDVAAAVEGLEIKIIRCQLGAF